jgi:pantoate--beta-alanine ligase
MLYYKSTAEISLFIQETKKLGKSIGFVPTMGALHDGHISLIDLSRKDNDLTICSIFVNPTQFNQREDYINYPITLSADLEKLSDAGCQVVFVPSEEEIYPPDGSKPNPPDLGMLAKVLEGAFRPGHFDGVAQVVEILLRLVQPDRLYLGRKDYQQVQIISRMIELKKLPVEVVNCPIIREAEGLAMSSRNIRIAPEDRQAALALSKSLHIIADAWGKESTAIALEKGKALLGQYPSIRLEYFCVCRADSLEQTESPEAGIAYVALIAAWVGKVRLIDNIELPLLP